MTLISTLAQLPGGLQRRRQSLGPDGRDQDFGPTHQREIRRALLACHPEAGNPLSCWRDYFSAAAFARPRSRETELIRSNRCKLHPFTAATFTGWQVRKRRAGLGPRKRLSKARWRLPIS